MPRQRNRGDYPESVMKLYFTETSPFARKVRVVAIELGLEDQIETIHLRPTPTKADAELSRVNPLSKIPVLILDDGLSLYDSPVICEYLDAEYKLTPARGPDRFSCLRLQALSDGILDAAILVFYERVQRPKELHLDAWLSGQTDKANQGLDLLERDVAQFGSRIDLGQICVAVTLGWLEFRASLGDIRSGRPMLFAWYDAFRNRPAMKATEPRV